MRTPTFVCLFAFAVMGSVGCTPPPAACDTKNCGGCCNAAGACVAGTSTEACGFVGGTCQTCSTSQLCLSGVCVTTQQTKDAGSTDGGRITTDGGASDPSCAGSLIRCGTTCIDPAADLTNCGGCGTVCKGGEVCSARGCELLPNDCATTGLCPTGFSCDPVSRKCTPGCRLPTDCPQGASCSGGVCSCPTNEHACGQKCVSSTAPTSCGATACTPCEGDPLGVATCSSSSVCGVTCNVGAILCAGHCAACGPTPDHATPSCTGASCDFTCVTGYHRCGDECLSDTSVESCGSSCSACPTNNSTATCSNGQCGQVCNQGFHLCGTTCVSNSSISSCGLSCSPCTVTEPNAAPSCDGTSCGFVCATGIKCNGHCKTCVVPDHASAYCSPSGECAFVCAGGFHPCGNECKPDVSTGSCGTSCTACPTDPRGTASCNSSTLLCEMTCNPGTKSCGGACAPCVTPTPDFATTVCNGAACDFVCSSGLHRCGSSCASNDAFATCGTACSPCTTNDPHADPACLSGSTDGGYACSKTCRTGYQLVGDVCEPSLRWVAQSPPTAPGARSGFAMAYDEAREQTVLYGGAASSQTWLYDGGTWVEVAKSGPNPGIRSYHMMAYDAARAEVVLYGGYYYPPDSGTVESNVETWLWNGSSWAKSPTMSAPGFSRFAATAAFDSYRGQVVLFGGWNWFGTPENETHDWNGSSWSTLTVASPPRKSPDATMAYDSFRHSMVLFGEDTSEWHEQGPWQRVDAGTSPRGPGPLAYDPLRRRVVVVAPGRFSGVSETLEWAGTTWLLRDTNTTPKAGGKMVFDSKRGRMVYVTPQGATWELIGP